MIKDIPTDTLAEFLGVTPGFVSNIKAGRKRLPPKYVNKVSEHFDIPIHELTKAYEQEIIK